MAWFEIVERDGSVTESTDIAAQSFLSEGPHPVHFAFSSASEAKRIADELKSDHAPLRVRLKYAFSGDLVRTCTASADMASLRDTARFRDLFGAADGLVNRRLAVEAARDLVSATRITTRCPADLETDKERLIAQLDRLLQVEVESEIVDDDWNRLDQLGFDPRDVMSDVERIVESQSDSTTKTETREALEDARERSESSAAQAGWGGVSGSLSDSFAEKDSATKENLQNVMAQTGIRTRWEGERLIPRSVDVIANERMRAAFDRELVISDERLSESGDTRTVFLDEHRMYLDSDETDFLGPPGRELSTRLIELSGRLAGVTQRLGGLTETVTAGLEGLSKRDVELGSDLADAVPVGGILPFYGDPAALPSNWRICDGSAIDPNSPLASWAPLGPDGVRRYPDLRGRFIMGVPANEELGATGGLERIKAHRHKSGTLKADIPVTTIKPGDFDTNGKRQTGHRHKQPKPDVTGRTAEDGAADNRPPFVSLHYIIKIK